MRLTEKLSVSFWIWALQDLPPGGCYHDLDARMRETFAPQIATDQMQACYPINYGVTGLQLYQDGYINVRYADWDPSLQQAQ